MNWDKWASMLIKQGRNQWFTTNLRKKNSKGMFWASFISLAVSAAAYFFRRNHQRRVTPNMTSSFKARPPGLKPNVATVMETSEELTADIEAYGR